MFSIFFFNACLRFHPLKNFFSLFSRTFPSRFRHLLEEGLSFVSIITRDRVLGYESQPRSIKVSRREPREFALGRPIVYFKTLRFAVTPGVAYPQNDSLIKRLRKYFRFQKRFASNGEEGDAESRGGEIFSDREILDVDVFERGRGGGREREREIVCRTL